MRTLVEADMDPILEKSLSEIISLETRAEEFR